MSFSSCLTFSLQRQHIVAYVKCTAASIQHALNLSTIFTIACAYMLRYTNYCGWASKLEPNTEFNDNDCCGAQTRGDFPAFLHSADDDDIFHYSIPGYV